MSTIDAKELLRQYVKEANGVVETYNKTRFKWEPIAVSAFLWDCKDIVERLSEIQI